MTKYTLISNMTYDVSAHTEFTCKMLAMSHSETYGRAVLVDSETSEIMFEYENGVLTYDATEPPEEDFEPLYDIEMGFDPYEGGYTFDC